MSSETPADGDGLKHELSGIRTAMAAALPRSDSVTVVAAGEDYLMIPPAGSPGIWSAASARFPRVEL